MTNTTQGPVSLTRHDHGNHERELILDARNIGVDFKVEGGVVHAVKDVSFQLHKAKPSRWSGSQARANRSPPAP